MAEDIQIGVVQELHVFLGCLTLILVLVMSKSSYK